MRLASCRGPRASRLPCDHEPYGCRWLVEPLEQPEPRRENRSFWRAIRRGPQPLELALDGTRQRFRAWFIESALCEPTFLSEAFIK
jgi:hypothetical protein